LPEDKREILAVYLLQNTLGLGEMESLLADEQLEEVVVNNSREPLWVYHKKFGWCKTNVRIKDEETIYDYSSMIARKIGRQINVLNPMLDAHLPSGDRVNSTLAPILSFGNTMDDNEFYSFKNSLLRSCSAHMAVHPKRTIFTCDGWYRLW
jgi:flagellar protein FlaI